MRGVLFGFIGGVSVTSLVLILSNADNENTERASDVAPAFDSSTPTAVYDPQSDKDSPDLISGQIAATQESDELPQDDAPGEARLKQELEQTQQVLADVRAERDYLLRAAAQADGPVVSPISLPPEFDWLSENAHRGLFHERIQREYIDAAWAGAAEPQLSEFIYDRPEMVHKYGAPTIRCHTTLCEVTFLARGIYDDPSVAMADARALFDDFSEKMDVEFACGPGECWADTNNQDGVVTIYWGMTKNNAEQTQSSSSVVTALRQRQRPLTLSLLAADSWTR